MIVGIAEALEPAPGPPVGIGTLGLIGVMPGIVGITGVGVVIGGVIGSTGLAVCCGASAEILFVRKETLLLRALNGCVDG